MYSPKRPPVPVAIRDFLRRYSRYIIVAHEEPDGDCIGSALALGHYLQRKGASVSLHDAGPFDRPEIKQFEDLFAAEIRPHDLEPSGSVGAIIIDCSTLDRVGPLQESLIDVPIAVIDHHALGSDFGEARYVDTSAPSTSFLIQRIIEEAGDEPERLEARYLFFGLVTDTGFFRHLEKQSGDVFASAGRLVDKGISPNNTYNEVHGGRSLDSRRLLGKLLQRVEPYFDGRLLLSWMTPEDQRDFSSKSKDSDTLYQVLLATAGCQAVVFLRDNGEGKRLVSLRSTADINVGAVARAFGGGGHPRAAGFATEIPLTELKEGLLDTFAPLFDR